MSVILWSMKLMDKTTEKPQQKHYGKNGFRYKPQYGVVVICESEPHQQQIYAALKQLNLTLKVVTV